MSTILETFASMIPADAVGTLGKAFGVDGAVVDRAVGAAGPLMLERLSGMASAPGGADAVMDMLSKGTTGTLGSLGNLGSMLSGMMAGEGGGGLLASLLGPGANAIGASLSKALGFNVTPLLGMLAPAMLGSVSKLVKAENVDASGLSALLAREKDRFAGDPANAGTLALVRSAQAAGDEAAKSIASFGAAWSKVVAAPAAAMFMVAQSDLSGPVGAVKEAKAAGAALVEAAKDAPASSIIASAFAGGMPATAIEQLRDAKPSSDDLLDMIEAGVNAVAAKSPAEADAYRQLVRKVAVATAEAAKEGGFLGIGGTLVSDEEQEALDRIESALA